MSEEVFDVVNERDEVVGRNTRREVHRLGLRHRAVHVLVFNARGQVFLQQRSLSKDSAPGCWDSSCSGHLDAGEDYDACARRELREELGWEARRPLERVLKIPACEDTGQEFVWVYRHEAEGPFVLHPEEISGGEWLSPAEVDQRIAAQPETFARAFMRVWRLAGRAPSHPDPAAPPTAPH